jgi:formylglycine-generating enzyme
MIKNRLQAVRNGFCALGFATGLAVQTGVPQSVTNVIPETNLVYVTQVPFQVHQYWTNIIQYTTNANDPAGWKSLETNVINAATGTVYEYPDEYAPIGNKVPRTYRVVQIQPSTPPPATPSGTLVAISDPPSFLMGDATQASGDGPVHTVTVDPFLMETNLVSLALWQQVYNYAISHGYSFDHIGTGKTPNNPVQTVSWYDAVKWCNARSQMEGLTPCYYSNAQPTAVYTKGTVDLTSALVNWDANGYRLPTEAEWEKAARGKLVSQRFPWGPTISQLVANYHAFGIPSYDVGGSTYNPIGANGGFPCTSPVGSFKPNGYGLFDMAGNVEEWCWDRYAVKYYATSPASNPLGPDTGGTRVTRGGSWNDLAPSCLCSTRTPVGPNTAKYIIGFRCARSVTAN